MAGFLPDSFIQRVLDETDIVSLIDSYIPLQKKGKDHWSLCPFCEDGNNPSFSVSSVSYTHLTLPTINWV